MCHIFVLILNNLSLSAVIRPLQNLPFIEKLPYLLSPDSVRGSKDKYLNLATLSLAKVKQNGGIIAMKHFK